MEGLTASVSEATERFGEIEAKREISLSISRKIIRKTKNMIHAIHVGEDYSQFEKELIDDVNGLRSAVESEPSVLYSAAVEDAMMEYSEAMLLAAVIERKPMPSYRDLNISPQAWAMGLADCVGELRRTVLTHLTEGDLEDAQYFFARMDEIGDEVLGFDVPDAIVPIRRKQDVTRGTLERTRSDITNAVIASKIRDA